MLSAFTVVLLLAAAPAHAQVTEIFKCASPGGHWTYTNDRHEAERQEMRARDAPGQRRAGARKPAARATPNSFPKRKPARPRHGVGAPARHPGEGARQRAAALAKAKAELAEQESVRIGDERNYARVEERLQPFKDSVETHEKNIEALRRELGNQR